MELEDVMEIIDELDLTAEQKIWFFEMRKSPHFEAIMDKTFGRIKEELEESILLGEENETVEGIEVKRQVVKNLNQYLQVFH